MTEITERRGSRDCLHILDLPAELISTVLDHVPIRDLAMVSATCRYLRDICSHLRIWRELGNRCVNFGPKSRPESSAELLPCLPVREQCRIAHNWTMGQCNEQRYIKFTCRTGLLPWLQLTPDHLYVSIMNHVTRHKLRSDGRFSAHPHQKRDVKYTGHTQDINKFVVKENDVISCSRDGQVMSWDRSSGQRLGTISSDISAVQSVDATREVIVGGTNNSGVQMWRRSDGGQVHHIPMSDRVWSVRLDPSQRVFSTGSSGIADYDSLKLWDVETAHFLQVFGENKRRGAGILDLHFESSQVLLSAGYDTYIRQWDVRAPRCPILELEEPHDNIIYCISSDNNNFIAAGSCRHGVVRFWDKRRADACIQTFYVCRNTKSPVYSLQFNRHCLYVALSHGIHILDFNGHKT